jgi:hypothetical protein
MRMLLRGRGRRRIRFGDVVGLSVGGKSMVALHWLGIFSG